MNQCQFLILFLGYFWQNTELCKYNIHLTHSDLSPWNFFLFPKVKLISRFKEANDKKYHGTASYHNERKIDEVFRPMKNLLEYIYIYISLLEMDTMTRVQSWSRLFVFHRVPILFAKVWIQTFFFQLSVNYRRDLAL